MYQLIYLPIIAAVLTQLIKMIINGFKNKFNWKDINSYGGMPSSHSAMVVCLAASVGYYQGWNSAVFAVALVFAILTIRDAGGFRMTLSRHAKELNQIISDLNPDKQIEFKHLRERIGHTPLEILVGSTIGVLILIAYIYIF